jgi:hypothetical protein
MELNDMLEKILSVPMEINLRNELLKYLFLNTGKKTTGIPRLKDCQSTLNCDEIFARMKTAAGGTGVSNSQVPNNGAYLRVSLSSLVEVLSL